MLLAIASVTRSSELKILDTKYMAQETDKVVFYLNRAPKNHNKLGKLPNPLIFNAFEDTTLCPVASVREYIARTKTLRDTTVDTQFFLATIKPHRGTTGATIGTWLKAILERVRLDTAIFNGHSTRAASTSSVRGKGASIADIIKTGNWSNSSTWQKFYNRNIVTHRDGYQKVLLGT